MTACAALLAAGFGVATAAGLVPEVVSVPAGPFMVGLGAAEFVIERPM